MAVGIVFIALLAQASADPLAASGSTDTFALPGSPEPEALPVTGGFEVEDDAWPDTAGLQYYNALGYVQCTGTLIAPDVVVTAGHCLNGSSREQPTQVILGTNNYRQPGEEIDVVEVHEYPNSQTGGYDAGVLVLAEESSYEPRTIATDCIRDYIQDGATVHIVGYGAYDIQGQRYDSRLREGVSVITDADCSQTNKGCNPNLTPNGELGAGEDGVDACYGDSGGPLYLPTPKGTFLVGITSRGWYSNSMNCGNGGVWERPDSPRLWNWIEEVTGRQLARPSCLQPTAPALYAVKNRPGFSQIDPNVEAASFTYEVLTQPTFGGASVDGNGLVRYQPETGFMGEDSVRVGVTAESGENGEVTIPVKMVSRGTYREMTGTGAGCSTIPSPSVALALVGLLLASRRARRGPIG